MLRKVIEIVVIVVLIATAVPARVPPEVIESALDASVYIRVERRYHGHDLPSSGSGFFIDDEGHVMTNWHVVADQVELPLLGERREVNITVLSVTVVVGAGSGTERSYPARVIARDRKLDLALLQVQHRSPHFIRPARDVAVALMDEVCIVGFPFGDLLAFEETGKVARDEGTPEPSVNVGRVTSLRRDAKDELVAVQTDAAVNPGNSGGPMLSAAGELVGVVYAEISGGSQIGFAIAPDLVWRFYERQSVRVRFVPPFVSESRRPLKVEVTPGVGALNPTRGEVRLEGSDIEPVRAQLVRRDDLWIAMVEVPEPAPGREPAESYLARVRLWGPAAEAAVDRRYRLEVRQSSVPTVGSQRAPEEMMRDRQLLANELSIEDYAKKRAAERAAAGIPPPATPTPMPYQRRRPTATPTPSVDRAFAQRLTVRGEELLNEKQYELAVELLNEALKVDPGSARAAELLEEALARLAEAELEEYRRNVEEQGGSQAP